MSSDNTSTPRIAVIGAGMSGILAGIKLKEAGYDYYIEEFAQRGGPTFDFEVAFTRYRQQLFAGLAWWSGTLGQPPEAPKMQPPETSLEFIRRTCVAIDDLDALDSFD